MIPKGIDIQRHWDAIHVEISSELGKDSFPLVRRAGSARDTLFAEVRPNLIVELSDQKLFSEAIVRLERPLNRSSIRTLSLDPGGPQTLSSTPRLEAGKI